MYLFQSLELCQNDTHVFQNIRNGIRGNDVKFWWGRVMLGVETEHNYRYRLGTSLV